MVTITSWRIVLSGGVPVIYQWNDRFFVMQKATPRPEDIVVTQDGIEYDYAFKRTVTHYKCPFSNLSYSKAPLPTAFREKLGGSKAELQKDILSFLYEFIAGVLFSDERYSFIKDRGTFDIVTLLAEYGSLGSQIDGIDWEKAASHIKIKEKEKP